MSHPTSVSKVSLVWQVLRTHLLNEWMLLRERVGCPRLRTQTSQWRPSQAGLEHRTNAVFIRKLTRTLKPAQCLSNWKPWARWRTSLGLICQSVEHKYQLHGLRKEFFQRSGMKSYSTTPWTAMHCYLLTLTGKAGACKARPRSGKTRQGSRDSPPSLGPVVMSCKEPQLGKKPGSCVQLCQWQAMRPQWSPFVSLNCCFSFVK